jgi:signal transduction histidine kinase
MPRLGLRARGGIAFAGLALFTSATLAIISYEVARSYLLSQRDSFILRQATANASTVNEAARTPSVEFATLLAGLPTSNGTHALVRVGGEWVSAAVPTDPQAVPTTVRDRVASGVATRERVTVDGVPAVVVGIPLTTVHGEYYEIAPLADLQRTLRVLGWSVTVAALVTTLLGAGVGVYLSRRVLQPLRVFARGTSAIAHGDLSTRLTTTEPDLASFADSFNDMASSLEDRLAREERFASDVSHELRTPLTALGTAVDVLDLRADPRTQPAIDVLRSEIDRFNQLVLDLLEISRADTGPQELVLEDVSVIPFLHSTLEHAGQPSTPMTVDPATPERVRLDKRRVDRLLVNLLDNAARHGGGATCMAVRADDDALVIGVADEGPGVPADERELIFERFHRGTSAASTTRGTGLGLAIVLEHCRALGGTITVDDNEPHGARFVVRLPITDAES